MDGRTYGRTDMTTLTVAFRNFANAPKNASDGNLALYKAELYNLMSLHILESYAAFVDVLSIEYETKTRQQCDIPDSD
jgi:hypothetical protein